MPFLSKSKYLLGQQCPKILWTHYNAKHLLPETSASTQAMFDEGHAVGELAKQLYPDGIEVDWNVGFDEVVRQSTELLAQRKPLFEAGFKFKNTYARADILNPVEDDLWDIIEVKSNTKVKPINHHDLTFQRYCYEGAGLKIRRCCLMHINNQYVRHGDIDPQQLLVVEDVTHEVDQLLPDVPGQVSEMLRVIALKKCPQPDISPHCKEPYDCDLGYPCWDFLPKDQNIFHLYRGSKKSYALLDRGIHAMADIPADVQLSAKQRIQVDTARSREPHSDQEAITRFLDSLIFPQYHLDFETFRSAIPKYDNTKPYSQVPFQFSLHVWKSFDTKPVHHSFLADGPDDPRPAFLAELRRLLGNYGDIVIYNRSFEETRLDECTKVFPEYRDWFHTLQPRFVDLLLPFRKFDYYHPSQNGSASIKHVLPVLTDKSYEDLEIADGNTANLEYMRVTFGDVDDTERQRVRTALEHYCAKDTMAMINIIQSLRELITPGSK